MKKVKSAQADLLLKVVAMADSPANLEAMQYVIFQFDFQDYEQFVIEAPPGSIRFTNLIRVAAFFDNIGALVAGGAIDPDVVFELFPVPWAKVEPVIKGMRADLGWPDMFDLYEHLGRQYQKWWETKRKRQKWPEGEAPPTARPRAAGTPRPSPGPRPAAPGIRPTPIRSAPPVGARPAPGVPAGPRPSPGAAPLPALVPARPGTVAGRPIVLRPPARPAARPGVRPGQPQRPAAKPAGKKTQAKQPAKASRR